MNERPLAELWIVGVPLGHFLEQILDELLGNLLGLAIAFLRLPFDLRRILEELRQLLLRDLLGGFLAPRSIRRHAEL